MTYHQLKQGLKKDIIPMVFCISYWLNGIYCAPYSTNVFFKILIVIQGGAQTLRAVEDAIHQNVPILVLAVNSN